jgi:hypothetical protein
MINSKKLSQELIDAITTHGNCNSNGIVWDDDNNEIQNRQDVAAIIAAHDPTEEPKTTETFDLPVVAPDFIVQSPKPKKDPREAHDRAIYVSKQIDKSLAEIVLNLVVYIEELETRVDGLEKNGKKIR